MAINKSTIKKLLDDIDNLSRGIETVLCFSAEDEERELSELKEMPNKDILIIRIY